jgi:hypothetical protein
MAAAVNEVGCYAFTLAPVAAAQPLVREQPLEAEPDRKSVA